ncbi:hypothetical protein ACFQY4_27365 [Catellatospora bangladeshensis]|uniref:hypothetical protein n=1 Tax=Catellatospora bangladeshensis TaxID=310355 RepID=UPI003617C188
MTQPDKTPTDLLVQQGPSCWLYVVEAIAAASTAKTELSTTHLRMAMRCYPDSDSVGEAHAAQKHAPKRPRRTIALELMAANIAGMVTSLQNWALTSGTDDIPLSRVQEFARRHHVSRSAWQDPALGVFFDGDGEDDPTTDVTGLITAFQAGRSAPTACTSWPSARATTRTWSGCCSTPATRSSTVRRSPRTRCCRWACRPCRATSACASASRPPPSSGPRASST